MEEAYMKVLLSEFAGVYCDTCKHEDSDDCDDCHRKMMGWGLSENTARRIAARINAIVQAERR